MGHVQKRGPRRYLAVHKGDDGRRHSKTFERKLDADRWVAEQSVDVHAGRWVAPAAGRVTLGDYARQWVAERPIRASTRERYAGYLRHLGDLDRVPIADLRPAAMRTWQAGLVAGMAASSARTIRGVIATILRSAVVDRVIVASPLDGVAGPARPERVLVEPYSRERVLGLRDTITPRLAASIVLGAGCALRRGEVFGLTLDRVDFLRRTIRVDRQLVGVDDGRPVLGPPKTPASIATVPASTLVIEAIAAHVAAYPPTAGPATYVSADGRRSTVQTGGLLFVAARGGPVFRPMVGAAWRDAEVRLWAPGAGHSLGSDGWRIPAATLAAFDEAHPDGHGRRFHDLRHYSASTLIAAGKSVKVVQRFMRHANASETLDTYAHLFPDDDDAIRAAVDDGLYDDRGAAGSDTQQTGPTP